jgi:class 3 adenylate cyclase
MSTVPPVAAAAPPPISTAPEAAGERRYLTVMFCDLVDSTGISAELDAEEWRDLVGAYLDAASAAVTEMGGHVAKKLGEPILAPIPIIDPVAVANIEALLAAIPPDCVLHEPRKHLSEGAVELPRINLVRNRPNGVGAAARLVTASEPH